MKKKYNYQVLATIFAACLVLAGCSKNDPADGSADGSSDDTPNDPKTGLSIQTYILSMMDRGTINGGSIPETRTELDEEGSESFNKGDVLALQLRGEGEKTNIKYAIGDALPRWEDLIETGIGMPPYFCYAWYPALAADNTESYSFNAATAEEPDLLVAETARIEEGKITSLSFSHMMHKLVVRLQSITYTDADLNSATLSLLNMKSTVNVNLETGKVIPDSATGENANYPVKVLEKANAENKHTASFTFIVAPQSVTTGKDWIKVKIAGKEYIYQVPATIDDMPFTALESGNMLTVNLEVDTSDTGIVVRTANELGAAIEAASGTEEEPSVITLAADIIVPAPNETSLISAFTEYKFAGKHILINGNGHMISRTENNTGKIFIIGADASMKLTNLTMDGKGMPGAEFITVGNPVSVGSAPNSKLILGNGFILTNATGFNQFYFNSNGIYVNGTLVMEDGAEITGNGTAPAVSIDVNGTLQLKGGRINDNAGASLVLQNTGTYVQAPKASTVTIENALPSGSAYVLTLGRDFVQYDGDINPGAETIIRGAAGYALTEADLAKFTIEGIYWTDHDPEIQTTGYELYLDTAENAIKLRKTP